MIETSSSDVVIYGLASKPITGLGQDVAGAGSKPTATFLAAVAQD